MRVESRASENKSWLSLLLHCFKDFIAEELNYGYGAMAYLYLFEGLGVLELWHMNKYCTSAPVKWER